MTIVARFGNFGVALPPLSMRAPFVCAALLRRVASVAFAFAFAAASPSLLAASAKSVWRTVSPEELAEKTPQLEPEAPAEAVLYVIEVDDSSFPQERTVTEYLRYKIFAPDKVENITRLSGVDSAAAQNRVELAARLTLPSGATQEFGRDAIKEIGRASCRERVCQYV